MSPAQDAARLYERYARDLYRYCLAQLRSPEEAEDAVQNTFMRAFRALDAGVVTEFESAWLYRIATNVCLSRRALAGRRSQWQSDDELEQLPVPAPEVDPGAARELIEAVTALPKNQRDALLLREWRGLSYAEIADSLHTTVPAVETLLVRARRQLVSLLRPRRRATVLDGLLLVLLRFRSWFAAASPAQLAAGAAVIALGGAVAGADVGAADTHRGAPSAATLAAAPAAQHTAILTVRRSRTEAATAHHARTEPSRHRPSARFAAVVRASAPQAVAAATAAPAAPAPAPEPPANTEPRTAAPATTSAKPTRTSSPAPVTATTTTAQTPLAYVAPPPLPTVSLPTVTVPAVTLPAGPVVVPSVEVTVPTATVPAVTVTVPTPAIPPALPSGLLP